MRVIQTLIICLLVLLSPWTNAGAAEEEIPLSLKECVTGALENNLRIIIERHNPELAEASLNMAKEMFLPSFDLSVGRENTESPSYWWLQGEDTQISKFNDYSFAVSQQIPTGGHFSLNLQNYMSDTNQSFQLINPRFGSTLRLDFTQPLLKNFGSKISRREILIARNNVELSRQQLKTVVLETIYGAQEAYWNLFFAVENLKVKQQSLDLARDLLKKNQKEVEVGKLAKIEILNAETVVAQREADILQAEAQVRRSEDLLRNILNRDLDADERHVPFILRDQPEFEIREVALDRAMEAALSHRPDLLAARTSIETRELDLSIAKNQLLPALDFRLSYWSPGISGDQIIYLDNNPLTGIVIGTTEGSGINSLKDAFKFLYNNWSFGVTLTIPLRSLISRADYARAQIELDKSLAEKENTKRQILLEVRDAVREIETHSKRVRAYWLTRELAERRLRAEERKLIVGLTTNYFVLQFQEELATARSQEIKALVDYNLALAKLERATGLSLQSHNISLQ
ncbi:MAG: TolC family protein [Acidobacteria bacterium]|nr:TolC family protein [Acidobacteriota bacterium]MBU2438679.1 TolC family protein [Acidobacteriota bacterium]